MGHRLNALHLLGKLSRRKIPSSAEKKDVAIFRKHKDASVQPDLSVSNTYVKEDIKPDSNKVPPVQGAPNPDSVAPADPVNSTNSVTPMAVNTNSNPVTEKKTPASSNLSTDPVKELFTDVHYIEPTGPTFSKEQLEILASGKISDVFGPIFSVQDDYPRQVRLPEYPLLLADRITGLDAEPGSMGKGIIWTETDVVAGAWYLNDIYMPPGITVESGQCDLTLVSYLGADFKNKGKRVYRLLGCDLVYYGEPPRVGDTLCYQIHVDGHANIGETRIFFFHYDCRINGELRLSVRNAQAGFFSDKETVGIRRHSLEPPKRVNISRIRKRPLIRHLLNVPGGNFPSTR